jgi:hypothetical protein
MSSYINHYVADGFKKVCDVEGDTQERWSYFNIDTSMMYSDHRSWVYFIVDDSSLGKIVKIGETGNPLGIESSWIYEGEETQPVCGTQSRLGRLRRGGGTDGVIRSSLYAEARNCKVSIWAKACEITKKQYMIGGKLVDVCITSHKDQELLYLDYYKNSTGTYPWLNVGRK